MATAATRCKANTSACYFDVDVQSSSLALAISAHKPDGSGSGVTRVILCRLAKSGVLPWAASDTHTRQFKVTHFEMAGSAVAVCVLPPPGPESDGGAHCSDCALVATADGISGIRAISVFSVHTGELLGVMSCVAAGPNVPVPTTGVMPAAGMTPASEAAAAQGSKHLDESAIAAPIVGGAAPVAGGAAPIAGGSCPVAGGAASTTGGLAPQEKLDDDAMTAIAVHHIDKAIIRCDGTCAVLAFAQGDACVTQFYDVSFIGTHRTDTAGVVVPRDASTCSDRFGSDPFGLLPALHCSKLVEKGVVPTDIVLTRTNMFVSFSNGVMRWVRRSESGPVVTVHPRRCALSCSCCIKHRTGLQRAE